MGIRDTILHRHSNSKIEEGDAGRPTSLNSRVWRLVLIVAGGNLVLWAYNQFFGFDIPLLALTAGLSSLFIWAVAVRMLLLDARFKIFWMTWLLGGLALLPALPGTAGIWVASAAFTWIFLLFRKYRPYSHLTPRRRAALFLIAFLMLCLLVFGMLTSSQESVQIQISEQAIETSELPANTFAALGKNLFFYGISALQTLWFMSLFHLFFRIRLHFMRLRPKLAVSAFLLVLVPMFLVTLMGLLTLYGTLGESRAIRASNILIDWAEQAVRNPNFVHGLCPDSFAFSEDQGFTRRQGLIPSGVPAFIEAVKAADFSFSDWDPGLTGAYFRIQDELWLLGLNRSGSEGFFLWAGRIDAPGGELLLSLLVH